MSFCRPLVKLLAGMADISLNSITSPKKMHALCLAVEKIYYTRNLTFIWPFSFSTSLVKWPLDGSKSSHSLDGCSYSSGSVTTLRRFLWSSFQDKINVLKVVMLRYELITGKKRERSPGSGRMRQHLLRVVVTSSYWQSLWLLNEAFRSSETLLRWSMTIERPLFWKLNQPFLDFHWR